MAKWMVSAKKADFNAVAERFRIDPVIARIIRNRDIVEEEEIDRFLHGTLQDLHDPFRLRDAVKAAGSCTDRSKQVNAFALSGFTISTESVPPISCLPVYHTAAPMWIR